MQFIFSYVRRAIFCMSFVSWTIIVAIVFAPLGMSKKTAWILYKVWSIVIIALLRIICNISHDIHGLENVVGGGNILISKHQSIWETIIFLIYVKNPTYVIKEELLKIPFYGWYLKNMGMIPVNRHGGAQSMWQMLSAMRSSLQLGRNIIIFPQGTRVKVHDTVEQYPYFLNIVIKFCGKYKLLPVALNSGLFWPKGTLFPKCCGIITMQIMPAISRGTPKMQSCKMLQDSIENNSLLLANCAIK